MRNRSRIHQVRTPRAPAGPRERITGSTAAFVGTTPRAILRYHQIGLLPEPERGSDDIRDAFTHTPHQRVSRARFCEAEWMEANARTVGSVSKELGVSVRTLHHWEEVGLAHPSGRTPGGYRTYDDRDVARLRRVLMFRDLGVPLSEIPALLDGTGADRRLELEARRSKLVTKITHLKQLAREVDALVEADQNGPLLDDTESAVAFGPDWNPDWARQAQERWGDTAQWAEYAERSARRTPQDWQEVTNAVRGVASEMGAAKRGGVAPHSPEAAKLVERHRQVFGEFFHCTLSMHVVLGRMIANEPDRRAFYDGVEAGLAAWMRDAIDEVARRSGIDPDAARWE